MGKDGLSSQEKIWLWGKVTIRAVRPLLLYFLMPAACMSFGYVAFHLDMSAVEFFTYGGNFYTAMGMVLTIVLLHRSSRKKGVGFFEDAALVLEEVSVKKAAAFLAFGFSSAIAVSAVLTLLPQWGPLASYSEVSQNMYKGRDILFTVVTTVLLAPFVEEIIFRGYMLNTYLQTFEEKPSILAVSILFAACHVQSLWVLYAFAMGLLLAWTSIKENTIVYGIMMHVGFNLVSAVTWLLQSLPAADIVYGSRWLIAGYGLIGGLAAVLLARRYQCLLAGDWLPGPAGLPLEEGFLEKKCPEEEEK